MCDLRGTHHHGTGYRDPRKIPDDGFLGHRGAHCGTLETSRDDPAGYYLVLADELGGDTEADE